MTSNFVHFRAKLLDERQKREAEELRSGIARIGDAFRGSKRSHLQRQPSPRMKSLMDEFGDHVPFGLIVNPLKRICRISWRDYLTGAQGMLMTCDPERMQIVITALVAELQDLRMCAKKRKVRAAAA